MEPGILSLLLLPYLFGMRHQGMCRLDHLRLGLAALIVKVDVVAKGLFVGAHRLQHMVHLLLVDRVLELGPCLGSQILQSLNPSGYLFHILLISPNDKVFLRLAGFQYLFYQSVYIVRLVNPVNHAVNAVPADKPDHRGENQYYGETSSNFHCQLHVFKHIILLLK